MPSLNATVDQRAAGVCNLVAARSTRRLPYLSCASAWARLAMNAPGGIDARMARAGRRGPQVFMVGGRSAARG